jgi:streptomycin 6-kinase
VIASLGSPELRRRADEHISAWRVSAERWVETRSSILILGRRGGDPVVLKVGKDVEILDLFDGKGTARVYEHAEGAVLLELVAPATPLASLTCAGHDERASEVLAGVIAEMSPRAPAATVPTVPDWGKSLAQPSGAIPDALLSEARRVYFELAHSQSHVRLLHGDLHHHNVLFDSRRGWLAIDPKGVIGELEYEVGAALRNPCERPDLFTQAATIEKRVACFARVLSLDPARILAWGFAQAVLAAVWEVEDQGILDAGHAWIALADAIRPMMRMC